MARWLVLLGVGGCFPDDWNGQPYQPGGTSTEPTSTGRNDTGGTIPVEDGLVGTWVSEGSDLSELFSGAPFSYVSVETRFKADGSYVVSSEDDGGTTYLLSGNYTVVDGRPGTISLVQAEPYVAEAEGIWQVDGDELRYEVVQTVPDYGFAPPTAAAGFGSTAGPGMTSGVNIQTYVRQ